MFIKGKRKEKKISFVLLCFNFGRVPIAQGTNKANFCNSGHNLVKGTSKVIRAPTKIKKNLENDGKCDQIYKLKKEE